MSRSILFFLLCLSVLFNVFFIVGAMTWRVSDTTSESGEVNKVVQVLDLDTRQADTFRTMRKEFRTESAVLGQQLRRLRSMIAEELASDQPDVERLRLLTEQESLLQAERHVVGTNQFTDFVGILSPDQRRQLGRRLMGPPGSGHPPEDIERRALEKFDVNGDGLLDEQERATARDFARQMQAERRAHRRQLERRFDLDGDGQLSPEEQEALRQYLLENRGQRGDRRGRGDRPHPPDRRNAPPPGGNPPSGPPPGF
ncbi:MAG: periplasmic heavy metal sensor [Planctomycetota bacterium]|nr:periplasmic heavy metal sensor [Planctomycetota bacterium]